MGFKEMAGFQSAHHLGTLSVFSYTSPRASSPSVSRLKTGGERVRRIRSHRSPRLGVARISSVHLPSATSNCRGAWVCVSVLKAGRNSFTALNSISPIRNHAGALVPVLFIFFSLAFWTETKCALVTLLTPWSIHSTPCIFCLPAHLFLPFFDVGIRLREIICLILI